MTTVQEQLREKIDELFPIDRFIESAESFTFVKNSIGIKCIACGSDNIYTYSRQTRSGDEAETKYCYCIDCKKTWRFKG